MAQVGDEAAERIGEAGPRRDQHLRDAELARQRRGMQRAGAAEREQGEVARVVAARQAHHADRAGHPVVGDAHDRQRRRGRVEAERRADLLQQRRLDRRQRHAVVDGEQPVRVEPAEDDVGVGDRRPGAAAAVADRPRRRAGALRADAQHARGIDRGDRAAAGADGVDVDHRHVDRHRVLELEVARDRRLAAEHERDVARGAAHVVGDDVAELARRARRPASPSPRRRSRPTPAPTSRSRPRARRRSSTTPCRRCPASPAGRARSRAPRSSLCSRSM